MSRPGGGGGPAEFPAALRRAVAHSGLSLRQLSERMQLTGHDLSVATLSYWQTGARVPSRRASLAAIGDLERALGVARGELATRLTRDRSRRDTGHHPGVDKLQPESANRCGERVGIANAVLASWGLRWDEGLRRVALHTHVELDACGRPRPGGGPGSPGGGRRRAGRPGRGRALLRAPRGFGSTSCRSSGASSGGSRPMWPGRSRWPSC